MKIDTCILVKCVDNYTVVISLIYDKHFIEILTCFGALKSDIVHVAFLILTLFLLAARSQSIHAFIHILSCLCGT